MIALNRDQQLRPHGGHQFPEQGMVVRGESFDEVVSKVRGLRIANGRLVGDPAGDVLRYYAERWPFMVHADENPDPEPDLSPLYVLYRHWVRATWSNPPKKLVTRKEASMRWDVCINCPRNKKPDWKETDESAELSRRAFILRCGVDIPDKLGFCALHKWDSGVAVFMDAPAQFSIRDKKDSEASCWVQ